VSLHRRLARLEGFVVVADGEELRARQEQAEYQARQDARFDAQWAEFRREVGLLTDEHRDAILAYMAERPELPAGWDTHEYRPVGGIAGAFVALWRRAEANLIYSVPGSVHESQREGFEASGEPNRVFALGLRGIQ